MKYNFGLFLPHANFFYGKRYNISHKLFYFFKNGQKKCPIMKPPKNFWKFLLKKTNYFDFSIKRYKINNPMPVRLAKYTCVKGSLGRIGSNCEGVILF